MTIRWAFILFIIFLNINLFAKKSNHLDNVSLLLQWKHQFQFAGYYVAKEKGYYKDIGLDVDIREFEFGLDVAQEVVENRVNYAVGKSTLLINSANGDDIVLLAAIYQSSPHILLALKKSGIKTIKDLKNKTFMMTGDAKNDATFMSMLFSKQINLNYIRTIEHSFNLQDLVDGKTDVMASYISNEPFRLKEEYGLESQIFDPKDYGFDVYNDILFTNSKEIENNPKRVSDFTKATLKGWQDAFGNIEETVDLILSKYNTQNKSKEALIFEANELKKLAYYKTSNIGEIKKQKLEEIFFSYKVMGLVSNDIDFEKLLFNENSLLFSKEEKEYLKEKESISLCVPDMMPYMGVGKNGEHLGISNDIFKIFQKYLPSMHIEIISTKTK